MNRMITLIGCVITFTVLSYSQSNQLCELELAETVECLAPEQLTGDTLYFKNALTRIKSNGLRICGKKEVETFGNTAVLYMLDRSSANNNVDKNGTRVDDVKTVLEYQAENYPGTLAGYIDFAADVGTEIEFTEIEDFDESEIPDYIKLNGRAKYTSLDRASEMILELKADNPEMNVVIYYITDAESAENLNRITVGLSRGSDFSLDSENNFDVFYMINSVASQGATRLQIVYPSDENIEILNNSAIDNNKIFENRDIPNFDLLQVLKDNLEETMHAHDPNAVQLINVNSGTTVTSEKVTSDIEGVWDIEMEDVLALEVGYNSIRVTVLYQGWIVKQEYLTIHISEDDQAMNKNSNSDFALDCFSRSQLQYLNTEGDVINALSKDASVNVMLSPANGTTEDEYVNITTTHAEDAEQFSIQKIDEIPGLFSPSLIGIMNSQTVQSNGVVETEDPDVIRAFWVHASDPRDFAVAHLVYTTNEDLYTAQEELSESVFDSIVQDIVGEDVLSDDFYKDIADSLAQEKNGSTTNGAQGDTSTAEGQSGGGISDTDSTGSNVGSEPVGGDTESKTGNDFVDYSNPKVIDALQSIEGKYTSNESMLSAIIDGQEYVLNTETGEFEPSTQFASVDDHIGQLIEIDISYPDGGPAYWKADFSATIYYWGHDAQFLKMIHHEVDLDNNPVADSLTSLSVLLEWLPELDEAGYAYLTSDDGIKIASGVIVVLVEQKVVFTLKEDFKTLKKGYVKKESGANYFRFGYIRPNS